MMIVAIFYLVYVAFMFLSTNGNCHLNFTHIMISVGIIAACERLDGIEKQISKIKTESEKNNHAESL
ncbi:hypothetical protein [Ethanoligenens sp.]|uniref:hypothetical protein n=1 Tax=Ethanoligenens sp. TaxID=2099655 RepID=UPI0039ECBD76